MIYAFKSLACKTFSLDVTRMHFAAIAANNEQLWPLRLKRAQIGRDVSMRHQNTVL